MHDMWGFTGVAGHRALSAGTLLMAAGGLALYQMTSLVLGPAGSRELHLSLSIPVADPDERGESLASVRNLSLGTLDLPSPAPSARAATIHTHRGSSTPAGPPAAAPLPPVAPQPPKTQPSPPLPPVAPLPASKPGAHKDDDTKPGEHKDDHTKAGASKGDDTD
jgi:hypothetical protein